MSHRLVTRNLYLRRLRYGWSKEDASSIAPTSSKEWEVLIKMWDEGWIDALPFTDGDTINYKSGERKRGHGNKK